MSTRRTKAADGQMRKQNRLPAWLLYLMVAVAITFGGGLFFWKDLCIWRGEVSLNSRDLQSAKRWIAWANWFGASDNRQLALLQIRLARRQEDFAAVEKLLQSTSGSSVPSAELERERLLAMAQTNQFQLLRNRWPELLSDPRSDGPEIAKAYYTWCMLNRNLAGAQRTLELWQADYPRDPEPLLLAGHFYESMINWKPAEENYRKAAELAPNDVNVLIRWANAMRVLLKTAEAQRVYEKCLKADPASREAILGLAQCVSANGDFAAAATVLREALAKHPNDFTVLKDYGEVLLASGDAEAAIGILQKAYEQVPEHANLAYSLAKAFKATGRATEAAPLMKFVEESRPALDRLNHLERQLRLSPNDLALRMEIADLTAKYVSRRDAISWYKQLLRVAPHYEPANREMMALQQQLGDAS